MTAAALLRDRLAGHPLTPRELQILTLVADGTSNAAIGARLVLSEDTVKQHVRRLFAKLGARDRAHAVHLAYQHRLLLAPDAVELTRPGATEAELITAGRQTAARMAAIRSDLATLRSSRESR